jgi:hypothetical protein
MASIPAPLIKLLDKTLDQGEHVIWQARPEAWTSMMSVRFLWWIGAPWTALTVFAALKGWTGSGTMFFLLAGVAMLAGPIMLYVTDLQTLFVITDRRALSLRTAWGKKVATSTSYAQMDKKPEAFPISNDVGHLKFAPLTKSRNTNSGSGFRCVKDVEKVRFLLQQALAR